MNIFHVAPMVAQSLVDFGPIINALKDAGITGYLLVAVIVGFLAYRIAVMRLRNEGTATSGNAAVMTSLSNAITTLTTNITTITQAMQEMQTGARKRDLQFDKMNDIQEKMNEATGEQNKILKDVNNSVNDLKSVTESGHTFTKDLVDSVVHSSKDTSEAVQALDKRIEDTTKDLQNRFDKLPADILKEFAPSLAQIRAALSRIIDPLMAKQIADALQPGLVALVERVLVDCLKQNAELAKELDRADNKIDDTATRQAMLSMIDGDANRKLIDGDRPEPPEPGKAAPVPTNDKPIDEDLAA